MVLACVAALIAAALLLPRSFHLTALSDILQGFLLLCGALAFLPHAFRSHGRARAFWALLASGMALWFAYQATWVYFEVLKNQEVPDIFAGDIILFLHIVPMIAAMALRPHAPQDEYAARLRHLDFILLMFWWAYLYVFAVMAWQYVVPDVDAYGNNLNSLYLIEKVAFLATLGIAWWNSRGGWKKFYANLFGASLTYAASSYVANWALSRHLYYSGSLYDIPLALSMVWITLTALWSRDCEAQPACSVSTAHGVWLARMGMIAVFSLPLFAAWTLPQESHPHIRAFRLVLTLVAAFVMGLMVFVRQTFLDRELRRLLQQSQDSIVNLKRLQAQITESEKLASIGQLVGGAAHELNNPITAMLGYSDLLLSTDLTDDQQALAARIGQQVRRTKSLVASLLSFARQGSSTLAPVNLTMLLRTAVKLTEPQCKSLHIQIDTDFAPDMPRVMGDSNQLLQVCVQMLNSAIHALERRNATLTVTCEPRAGRAVVHVFDASAITYELACQLVEEADSSESPDSTSLKLQGPLSGLGLSACRGILRQHHGKIFALQNKEKGLTLGFEIPLIPAAPELSLATTAVPVLWQTQPFA